MSTGIFGRKLGMTQIVGDEGEMIPVTVIEAGPCKVVQKKTVDKDGYSAIQIGFLDKRANLATEPEKGHFKKAKVQPKKYLGEIRIEDSSVYELGQEIDVNIFAEGDIVDVTGVSKGKGTAGVIKRWGFRGGKASHGAEKVHRKAGSIGQGANPSRVFKGMKMPGRSGNERVTIQNLTVAGLRKADNILLVMGGVPGHKDGFLFIKKAIKKG